MYRRVLVTGSLAYDHIMSMPGRFAEHILPDKIHKLNYLIDKVRVVNNGTTATGFVITDRDDNQIWGFYQGAMKYSGQIDLGKILKPGDFLVIAPNDPKAMLTYARQAVVKKIPYLFDPAFNIPHFTPA